MSIYIMHKSIPGLTIPPGHPRDTPGNLPDRQFTGVENLPVISMHRPGIVIVSEDPGDLTSGFTFAKLITCAMRIKFYNIP